MTRAPRHAAAPRVSGGWALVAGTLVLAGIAMGAGALSTSVILDVVSLWPVWVGAAGLFLVLKGRRVGRIRLQGLVPLILTILLLVVLAGNALGLPWLPSASAQLNGPAVEDVTRASFRSRVGGEVVLIGVPSEVAYRVVPLRGAGATGVPSAVESHEDGSLSVQLTPDPDPGLLSFRGIDVSLSTTPSWEVDLAGSMAVDVTGLRLRRLVASGDGEIALGAVTVTTPVSLIGTFRLTVPNDVAVRVDGVASVPDDWSSQDGSVVAPTPGEGWLITVTDGSSIEIAYS